MSNYGSPGGPYPGQPSEPWSRRSAREPYGPGSDQWGDESSGRWDGGSVSGQPGTDGSPSGYDYPGAGYPESGHQAGHPGSGYPGPDPNRADDWYPPAQGQRHPFPEQPATGAAAPRSDDGYGTRYHLPQQQPDNRDWAAPVPPPVPTKRSGRTAIAVLSALAVLVCGGGATLVYLLGQDDPVPVTQPSAGPSGALSSNAVSAAPEPEAGSPTPESSTDVRFVKAGQCVRNEGDGARPELTITRCGPKTYEVLKRFDGATTGKDDARTKCAKVEGYTDWYFFDSPLDVLDYVLCLKAR